MKKLLVLGLFLVPFVASAHSLTSSQVNAIVSLLQAFGVSQDILNNVEAQLVSSTPVTPANTPVVTQPQATVPVAASLTIPTQTITPPVIPTFTVSNEGLSQTAYAGNNGYIFNTVQLYLSSGYEGANFNSIPMVLFTGNGANPSDLNNCQIWNGPYWDGSSIPGNVPLGGGIRAVSGRNVSVGAPVQFILDNRVTIGATQTIDLTIRCDISSSAKSGVTYQWSIDTNNSDWNLSGAVAGEQITVNAVQTSAPTITVLNPLQVSVVTQNTQQPSCIDSQEKQIKANVMAAGGTVTPSQLMAIAIQNCPNL